MPHDIVSRDDWLAEAGASVFTHNPAGLPVESPTGRGFSGVAPEGPSHTAP